MDDCIAYHLGKYGEDCVYTILENQNLDHEQKMYTFVGISGNLSFETCLRKLNMAHTWSSHAILIEVFNSEMTRAVSHFISGTEYLAYKIDGVIRIYV